MTTLSPLIATVRTSIRGTAVAVVAGLAAGVLLAVLWSSDLADSTIGFNVADSVLGENARQSTINGTVAGAIFALVTGFAGTFTACNIAVFGALPDVAARQASGRSWPRTVLAPLGWLSAGLLSVATSYGAIAVLLGSRLPQLSTVTVGAGMPARLMQSMIVFGLIGLVFLYLAGAALGLFADPFANRPRARLFTLGCLVAGFLVGRPYPLFHKLLDYAVHTQNPWYGALALALQALGNVLVLAALVVVLRAAAGWPPLRWLTDPRRAALTASLALLVLGTFLIIYWDVRLPARFGYGWFPTMPWNS
jgi:hypothetical protein